MKITPFVGDAEIEPGQVYVLAVVAPADGPANTAVASATVITPPEEWSDLDDKQKLWQSILSIGENAKEKGYVP